MEIPVVMSMMTLMIPLIDEMKYGMRIVVLALANDDDVFILLMICTFCFQRRPKRRRWMYHLASPEDLLLQLTSIRRQRTSPESGAENSDVGLDLLQLIMAFNANSDDSSDDDGDTNSVEDCLN